MLTKMPKTPYSKDFKTIRLTASRPEATLATKEG